MDYLVLSTIHDDLPLRLLICYDIACQFCKHFLKRMKSYLAELQFDAEKIQIRWAIPKNHWPCHGPNHSQFSLNFLKDSGRTYAEGVEGGWAHMNLVAPSTKEMAPETREAWLDHHWDAYNFMKLISLGASYLTL